ncbi:MAG: Rrf2 family transcriptional regulator [Candidatus Omnitrophota bacterium]
MRVTTKASYGVRALINLAVIYRQKQPLSIKSISQKEEISGVYLEQIFNRLKNNGLVKSVRGIRGGYMLAKAPADISIYDVIIALDENISPGRCSRPKGKQKPCARSSEGCVSKQIWDEVGRKIKETLADISLKDMADRVLLINSGIGDLIGQCQK